MAGQLVLAKLVGLTRSLIMAKPNILIFMTDQQRGATVLPEHPAKTPVLDRFRQRAATFDRARCPAPHCCPSRATFFTGLFPSQHGVWNNVSVQNAHSRGLNPGIRLWNQALQEQARYVCGFSGKWHVDYDRGPKDFGWQELSVTAGVQPTPDAYMGLNWQSYRELKRDGAYDQPQQRGESMALRDHWGDYSHYGINENPFGDQQQVDAGLTFIDQQKDQTDPWCLYVGTLGPHDPYVVPQRFLDMYDIDDIQLPPNFHDSLSDKPNLYKRTRQAFDQLSEQEHREAIRRYLAFCSYEDSLFGQLLERLAASGQADNTIVIYTSDHGDYLGEHGLWCKGLPCFDGAYDIPLMIHVPGQTAESRCSEFVGLQDLGHTICELAGVDYAPEYSSGVSLVPFLRGEQPSDWRDCWYTQSNGNEQFGIQRSITTCDWKYVHNGFDFDELYDLQNDPHQLCNLDGDARYDEIKKQLCARLWSLGYRHQDQNINSYIMVAFAPVGPGAAFDRNGEPLP
jgi:arylsulfatase A-like enzyme